MSDRRPDDFLALVRGRRRGRIKLYLGSSAGVGKTFRMLQEAHQLRARGVDIVIGFVETHGRPETEALVAGVEIVPPRRVLYRGIEVQELDLDAILARKPEIAIVDELPHTNPPEFPNRWRYQDVLALAEAGINVICAMNVQHLASLGDVVQRATGVRVRELVPDSFLREVDQLVNLDLSAEDLIERLRAGKIYPAHRIEAALGSFFRPENLEALRELALREVAESIDRRQAGQGAGKVMAAIASRGPNALRIVERASRIAGRLNTHWYVVTVADPKLDSEAQRKLHDVLEQAQRMGAEVVQLPAGDVVDALLGFAKARGVDHILMGKSMRSRWQELWKEGPLMRLIRVAEGVDVQVVPVDPPGRA